MNKRVNVYFMYAIVFLQGFDFYGPVATLYRQARGLSMYEMFLIESVSWILMIIFEVPWGWFADRYGYKKTLVLSNLLFFLSKIVFYKAYSFNLFLMERVLLACSISGISGCDMALLYSSVNEGESEKVFGKYNAFSTSGFLIASLFTSIIVKQSMDRTAFWTIIPYFVAFLLTLLIKDTENRLREKPDLRKSLKAALGNKQIVVFVLSAALMREVVQAVSVFLSQPQYIRSGINIKYFGVLTAIIQIIRLSSAKAYRISSKLGQNKSIQILYSLITISCFFLVITTSPAFSVSFIVLISGSMSLVEPMGMNIQNKNSTTGDRATILSIYAMIGDIMAAFTNVFIGKAADNSVEMAFKTCVFICICGYVLFYFYKSKNDNVEKMTAEVN